MISNLKDLINSINLFFLNNGNSNLNDLKDNLQDYQGFDWKNYIDNEDKNLGYNRTYIINSSLYDLVLISWLPYKYSRIHDHPERGCLLKIMNGCLKEKLYSKDLDNTYCNNLLTNQTSYIDNNIGYHQILNETNQIVYSLHIYCPGNYKSNSFLKE